MRTVSHIGNLADFVREKLISVRLDGLLHYRKGRLGRTWVLVVCAFEDEGTCVVSRLPFLLDRCEVRTVGHKSV